VLVFPVPASSANKIKRHAGASTLRDALGAPHPLGHERVARIYSRDKKEKITNYAYVYSFKRKFALNQLKKIGGENENSRTVLCADSLII